MSAPAAASSTASLPLATDTCLGCSRSLEKAEFSPTQWDGQKRGHRCCKECVTRLDKVQKDSSSMARMTQLLAQLLRADTRGDPALAKTIRGFVDKWKQLKPRIEHFQDLSSPITDEEATQLKRDYQTLSRDVTQTLAAVSLASSS